MNKTDLKVKISDKIAAIKDSVEIDTQDKLRNAQVYNDKMFASLKQEVLHKVELEH